MARKSAYISSPTRGVNGKAYSGPTKEAGKIDSIMGAEYRSPVQRKSAGGGRRSGR